MSGVALSTWCRRASEAPEDFVRRAADLGAAALALGPGPDEAWLAGLLAGGGPGLPLVAVDAPCPGPRHGRPPWLAAADGSERAAAIERTGAAVDLAAAQGAGVVVVRLGRLELKDGWSRLVAAWRRGELEDEVLERRLAERVALAPRALDRARFGLDAVLERAAAAGVTIALVNRARWFELPDEIDVRVLAADFTGAPLATWFDPAAAMARASLGFGRLADALGAFAGERCAGAWLGDAAGLQGGLPWGRGELDVAAVHAALPAAALRVVHAVPTALDEELAEAIARAAG